MFNQSKRRIIATLMTVLVAVIVATLAIIYFTTYRTITRDNKEMLYLFAESYDTSGFPNHNPRPADIEMGNHVGDMHRFGVSTFYAVAFNKDGSVKEILNDLSSTYGDEELVKYASELLQSGREYGVGETSTYLITEGADYILVSMMDTVIIDNTIALLMHYMLVFGIVAVIVLMIFSVVLARWIMKPLKEGYDKQRQFISDAGHELKTPISTINANGELLKREIGESQWLNNIIFENDRMSVMVKELLDLARLESVEPVLSDVDFSNIVLGALLPFEAAAFERNIDFSYDIEDSIIIKGDTGALEKLVSVLVDNAISHCKDAGDVKVSVNKESGKIVLNVANTGDPLDEEDKKHIFERFYRADKSREMKDGHYGLGLSIAKTVVSRHKGKLSVECANEQVMFIVTF